MRQPQGTLDHDLDHDLPEAPSLLELREYTPFHSPASFLLQSSFFLPREVWFTCAVSPAHANLTLFMSCLWLQFLCPTLWDSEGCSGVGSNSSSCSTVPARHPFPLQLLGTKHW